MQRSPILLALLTVVALSVVLVVRSHTEPAPDRLPHLLEEEGAAPATAAAEGLAPDVASEPLTDAEERAFTQLGVACTISGAVRDTYGSKLHDHFVVFLRPGQRTPRGLVELASSLHAKTAGDGSFRLDLPSEGSWRPVVALGGAVLFDDGRHTLVTREGPSRMDVTVQAATRLTLTIEDLTLAANATALSIYRRATPLEVARREARLNQPAQFGAADDGEGPLEDLVIADERAPGAAVEVGPALRMRLARQKRWRTVAPDGWIPVRSTVVPASGIVEFERLAHGSELRVGLRRADEVLRVAPPLVLARGEAQRATITPPPPKAADADPLEDLRSAPVVVTSTPTANQLDAGASWN